MVSVNVELQLTEKRVIEFPFPPSLNNLYANSKARTPQGQRRRIKSPRGRQFEAEARARILEQLGIVRPLRGPLRITAHIYPPDRARRDEDNLHKAPRDALTKWGVISDDCQFVESHNYLHLADKENPRYVVTIETLLPGERGQ